MAKCRNFHRRGCNHILGRSAYGPRGDHNNKQRSIKASCEQGVNPPGFFDQIFICASGCALWERHGCGVLAVLSGDVLNLASGDLADHDGGTDHVGGAAFALRTSGHYRYLPATSAIAAAAAKTKNSN